MKSALLLVADIHYREDAPEGASSIIEALVNDIDKLVKEMPEYRFYIAFAGDIVKKGENRDSYQAFYAEIDEKLRRVGLSKEFRLVVPGNHDLDRNTKKEEYDECIKMYEESGEHEEKFNDFIAGSTLLTKHFSHYEEFATRFAKWDDSFKVQGWGCTLDDSIGVYCLNTALCSFGGLNGLKDEGGLAVNTRDLVEWCRKTTCPVKILLLHHPLNHLNTWSQQELRHIIENNFKLCLCGHNHRPELYFSHVPQKALMCTSPPLFSDKKELLAYSIILIEENEPTAILYREYSNGSFYPSCSLAKTDNGRIDLRNSYLLRLQEMEAKLQNALKAFNGQPTRFIEPKISTKREFNEDPNELHGLISAPYDALIVAPPEFGLTCLGLHMCLVAFKKHNLWLYIDANHTKSRKVSDRIDEELLHCEGNLTELNCIVLDSWDAGKHDHIKMVAKITEKCADIPLIILAADSLALNATGSLSKLNKEFKLLHLQALSRNAMRQLVSSYNTEKNIGNEDTLLAGLANHFDSINIHRTPLNCYTLLRVLDSNYNDKLINKTKLLKAILFVLFTDSDSFSYLSAKPEVEECMFVLGCFCKDLVMHGTRIFNGGNFAKTLTEICESNRIVLDVPAMLETLYENNILVRIGDQIEFRHRYWVFYFAAEWMRHDKDFKDYILSDCNYVNYPEIIEFYSGIDGKRTDVLETLLSDLTSLIDKVDEKIGIESSFDPLSTLLWNPDDSFIQKARVQIAERVESSNLPPEIKDKHADSSYQSTAPYDQSFRTFLNEYSVLSLLNSIKAASRALRNSPFANVRLRDELTLVVLQGWEEFARVAFWIAPILAAEGQAIHDGLALRLTEGFSEELDERYKQIIVSNPYNIVKILGGDLASRKIGPLLEQCFEDTKSTLQKHMIGIFTASVRPVGWYGFLKEYINLLHPRSFYIGDMFGRLSDEISLGDLEDGEEAQLKLLTGAILSKREYAPKVADGKEIPPGKLLSTENKLSIDKLLKGNRKRNK